MNDSQNKKDTLKVAPPTLSLTKTVESGKVKQNFQRGKSKTVTVEVKKTRTFARSAGVGDNNMVEVNRGSTDAAKQRMLNKAEQEARLRALQHADKTGEALRNIPLSHHVQEEELIEEVAIEEEQQESALTEALDEDVVAAPQPEAPRRTGMDDITARNLAALRSAPSNKPAAQNETTSATKKPASVIKRTMPAPTKTREEEAGADAKGKDSEYRRSGKLTIAQALGMDGEELKVRSLAQVKRQRAKIAKKAEGTPSAQQEKFAREVTIPEAITVADLANRMAERTVDVIKLLMKLGTMATPQQAIDADTAEIVVTELGHKPRRVSESDVEVSLVQDDDTDAALVSRPPVVTVMGHVDHGKTSLLDAFRSTDVVAGEAGGITQHIGAYQVQVKTGERITFLDTPGHEAFTAMRARGAKVTDIVILVVAADDGIMPQTEEAINHAKAAGVPIIVAVNKIDKPDADPQRIKTALMSHGLVPEEFGGETQVIEVSAKQRINLDKLEEAILLQAEMMALKVNVERKGTGTVIEAKVDKGRGTVATLLVQRGTLKVGDIAVAGAAYGRVRALVNDKGQNITEATPSVPVEILGLDTPPEAGDEFAVVNTEKEARDITEYRRNKEKRRLVAAGTKSMDQLFAAAGKSAVREMTIIVKTDVHGSAEAISGSLAKFNDDEVKARVLHSAVGAINESDVSLASATGAMIIGFNVRATPKAKEMAASLGIAIRYYSIIYELIDDVKAALSGLLSPELRENLLGYAEMREIFNITKVGKVAGCMVTEGLIKRGAKVRLLRDNVVIHEGSLKTLKRFKDEVKEVKSGFECGMAFENYDDIRAGDMIEAFEIQEFSRIVGDRAKTETAAS
jgi:translation initiation factor IF-2